MLHDTSLLSDVLARLEPALPYLEPISWALLHALWQGALLAGLLALALWLLRGRSAHLRYALSVGTLAALLVLPIATVLLVGTPGTMPASTVSNIPALTAAEQQAFETALAAEALMPLEPQATSATTAVSDAANSPSWTMALPVLAALWLMGVVVLMLRLGGSLWYVRQLRTQGVSPLPEAWARQARQVANRVGVHRAVRFVASSRATVPMVIGWWRPVVLLPASMLSGMPPAYIEAILMHELAHIQRHDALVGWLQVVGETLLFFHPATWWISRRIRMEREHCCDDRVVQLTGKRATYARALAHLEALRQPTWHPAPAATDGALLQRIRRILGQPVQQRLVDGWRAAAGVGATAMLGLLAAGVLLASTPASDVTSRPDVEQSTLAALTPPQVGGWAAALGLPLPAADTTAQPSTFTHDVRLGEDTLQLRFNDPAVKWLADSTAMVRFRGDPSARVFMKNDSLRTLRAEDFAFVMDSLRVGGFPTLHRGITAFGESMEAFGKALERLALDSLIANPQGLEGPHWWNEHRGAARDTLELRSWRGLSQEERQAQLDSLMAQARSIYQPSAEQRARRDSLIAQARSMYQPSPEQQAHIDSLRSRLRGFTELTPERRAQMDSVTAMLRDLQQPSAEERARVDSLMARAQALVRPSEQQQARLDSLQALIQQLAQPSSEQLRRRAEALRQQAERLEAQAQALEQDPPSPPQPPTDPPPPSRPPDNDK